MDDEDSEFMSQGKSEYDDYEGKVIQEELYDDPSVSENVPDEDYDMMTIKNENVNPKKIRGSKKRKTLTGKKEERNDDGTLTKDPETEKLTSAKKLKKRTSIIKKQSKNQKYARRKSTLGKKSHLEIEMSQHKEPETSQNSKSSRRADNNKILDTDIERLESKVNNFKNNGSATKHIVLIFLCPIWICFYAAWGGLIFYKYKHIETQKFLVNHLDQISSSTRNIKGVYNLMTESLANVQNPYLIDSKFPNLFF